MAILKLADDCDLTYILLGLQSGLEDYLLAYRLNQQLGLRLKRVRPESQEETRPSLPKFEYDDTEGFARWILVPNRVRQAAEASGEAVGLFGVDAIPSTRYVLEEFPKIDYLLRIETEDEAMAIQIKNELQQIAGIRWVGRIDPSLTKTKDLILF